MEEKGIRLKGVFSLKINLYVSEVANNIPKKNASPTLVDEANVSLQYDISFIYTLLS